MQIFLKVENGAYERHIEGKMVGQGAPTGRLKGGHDRGTYPYPLSRSVPPGAFIIMKATGEAKHL